MQQGWFIETKTQLQPRNNFLRENSTPHSTHSEPKVLTSSQYMAKYEEQ